MRLAILIALFAAPLAAAADLIYGTGSDGYQYGTDGTHGLLIAPDGTRFVYLDRQAFLTREHGVICVRWNDNHEECVYRYDADLDRMATNFDIDPYFAALISGEPNAGGFVYTNADNDAFVDWLFTDRHP